MGTATARRLYLPSPPDPTSKERKRAMSDTVQEFFKNLETRADSSKTAGMTNSYVFDIEGAGQWKVDVDDGKVTVTEGGGTRAPTTPPPKRRFRRSSPGGRNPRGATMTGKLKARAT